MSKRRTPILLLFLISFSYICAQQKDVVKNKANDTIKKINHIHSDRIEVNKNKYNGNQLFTGDVRFEQDGTFLVCDSAIYYEEGEYFHAFSNARLYNDTLSLSAYSLEYNGKTQVAKAKKNVHLVDKSQNLYAEEMDFNRHTQVATAIGNVVFDEGSQRLTSDRMIYNRYTHMLEAIGNVVFTDPKQKLETERILYNQATKIAQYNTGATITTQDGSVVKSNSGVYNVNNKSNTLTGQVLIENNKYKVNSQRADYDAGADKVILSGYTIISSKENPSNYIQTTKGIYYNNRKEAFLEARSSIYYSGKILRGDKIYYNQRTGFGKATGNVVLEDPQEERLIKGTYAEAYENIDSTFITGNAYAAKNFKGDTLFLHADTLMAVGGKNKASLLRAFHKARMYKSNVQAKCDSISLEESSGVLTFFRNPIVWFHNSQITGDTIRVYNTVAQNRLDSIHVYENAFVISQVDSIREVGFNQLKSKYLYAYAEDNDLKLIKAKVNAQSITYVEDQKKETGIYDLIGINRSDCGIIETEFIKKEVELVSCLVGADSTLYPPSKLPPEERFLLGFDWREKERLKSKEDLFIEVMPVEGQAESLEKEGG